MNLMQTDDFFTVIIQSAALGFSAAVSPGAFQSFLLNQALSNGWKSGIPVVLSPLISDPPIVITILLLLDQLSGNFISAISLFGGIFALYLAWGAGKQWRAGKHAPGSVNSSGEAALAAPEEQSFWRILGKGATMNLLSPGPYTFWTFVLGPLLLSALQVSILQGAAFLFGFYSCFLGGMFLLVLVFDQTRRLGSNVVRALSLTSIFILFVFGILLIQKGLTSLGS
jgi:threonine/homoserine/homoserine lactone efflux protein